MTIFESLALLGLAIFLAIGGVIFWAKTARPAGQ
jgi:hypothetical protein